MSTPRLLVVQHEDDAPPAWFGDWWLEEGATLDVVFGHRGDTIPETIAGYDALVVLGGEMGASDDAAYPWLTPTKALIARTVEEGGCFLGICLGHQLAAVALGGEVIVNPHGQTIGLTPVQLTRQGRADPLLGVIADGARSAHWNSDVVARLPNGSVEVARTPDGSVQAARFGPRAWGVQFHPEISPAVFESWAVAATTAAPAGPDLTAIVGEVLAAEVELGTNWAGLARRWTELVATPIPVP